MTNIYTLDSLAKHPLEAADWELPGHDCRCGEPMNETDRCCSICRRESAQLARDVVKPALAWARKQLTVAADSVRGDGIRSLQRAHRYGESSQAPASVTTRPVTHALAQRDPVDGETIRAPESDEPAAPLSVATIYDLIRSHAGFMLLVAGGV